MSHFPDHAQLANIELIEKLYSSYCTDPKSVDPSWRHFFEGIDFASILFKRPKEDSEQNLQVFRLIDAYRRFGHLEANFNPLERVGSSSELKLELFGFTEADRNRQFPTFGFCEKREATLDEIVNALKMVYSSRIGFEYMGCKEIEKWLQEKIEPRLQINLSEEEKKQTFENLSKAQIFETFIHTKYVGQKRFSLEGGETLIPILSELIEWGSKSGIEGFVLGMPHRGRLNVLANILKKPYSAIFQEFEDIILPLLQEGSGDVKYHKGFTSQVTSREGREVYLRLVANSSSLEAVDPIVLGETKAKQVLIDDVNQERFCSILMHGDAALAGQGVVYESLEFMRLHGYSTGGTIHIAINNQIGFTTDPIDGRSTRYCTDIAKTFGCPVFHVNAEDPESCIFVAKLAIELRMKFKCDVFIDLNCYRKYGHNEGDEPSYTQPLYYQKVKTKKTIQEIYYQKLLDEGFLIAKNLEEEFKTSLQAALERGKKEEAHSLEERVGITKSLKTSPDEELFNPFDSSAKEEILRKVAQKYTEIPTEFHLHPKLQKFVFERAAMLDQRIDWAMGEYLAFGSLLLENVSIRLSGQDVRRGTFSQRHAVLIDQMDGHPYCPLKSLGKFQIYNSPLSEFATLGFEFGYSWVDHYGLCLWEAQFGDFDIGAQTIIDHYIASAEKKWGRISSIVLLLPHGYEGQGPEHSSARIERFLQLAADLNMQIVNPTTPAQYFHVLRRQALRKIKKPLIVFTPKSLLRFPACSSKLDNFTKGHFEEFIENRVKSPKKLFICSGKIYYDLVNEIEKRKLDTIAILRIEQLYPLQLEKINQILKSYSCEKIYVQEEPENMGAATFLLPNLEGVKYVGRARSSVTATGSFKQHEMEFEKIIQEAFQNL